jgi:hypothetical protein
VKKNSITNYFTQFSQRRTILFIIFVLWLLLLLIWGNTVISRHSVLINGERYWYLADDAMISMRYARNLAQGYGLVWNPGEVVEGYTNFLWVLIMSVVHWFGIPSRATSFYIILLNIVFQLILLIYFYKLTAITTSNRLTAFLLAALFLIVDISSMVWSTAGFEMTLIAVLVTISTYKAITDTSAGKLTFLLFFLIGIIALVRADGIVLTSLFLGIIFVFTGITKRNIFGAILATAPFLLHLIFRYVYYGAFVPNTATLKLFTLQERLTFGLEYLLTFLNWYWPLFIFILIQLVRDVSKKEYLRTLIFAGMLAFMAYVVFIGGDGIGNNRFLLPIIPLTLVLAATSMTDILPNPRYLLIMAVGIVFLGRFSIFQVDFLNSHDHFIRYTAYLPKWNQNLDGVKIGVHLSNIKEPNDTLAVFPAGQTPYFSELYTFDMLGKSDRHIASLSEATGNRPGHNKFDSNYIMSNKPTFVFPGLYTVWPKNEDARNKMIKNTQAGHPWLYNLFTNDDFVTHCMPYPVDIESKQVIFQCQWE